MFLYATSFALGVLVALAVWVVSQDRKMRKSYRRTPFPPEDLLKADPILGHSRALMKAVKGEVLFDLLLDISRKMGFRNWGYYTPGSRRIVILSAEDLQHCFGKNGDNYVQGNKVDAFSLFGGYDTLATTDGDRWRYHRRINSHFFTGKQHTRLAEVALEVAKKVVDVLRRHVEEKGEEPIDIQKLMHHYTLDSILAMMYGGRYSCLDGNPDALEYQAAIDDTMKLGIRRPLDPWWRLKRYFGVGSERLIQKTAETMNKHGDALIKGKTEEEWATGNDIVSLYKRHDPDTTIEELRGHSQVIVNAARDTSAAASTWSLVELARNKDLQDKLAEEAGRESNLDNMHIAQSIWLETIRFHPSSPVEGRTAVKEDFLPSGTYVPAGTCVNFNPLAFNRNPKYYSDPDTYKPSRWIDEQTGQCKQFDQWQLPSFNPGSRACLGRKMGEIEVKTIITEICHEFELQLAPGYRPQYAHNAFLTAKDGVPMVIKKRV